MTVLINRGTTAADVRLDFVSVSELGASASSQYNIRDVYAKKDLGPFTGFYTVRLEGESAQMIKITGVNGGGAIKPSSAAKDFVGKALALGTAAVVAAVVAL